MCVTLLWLLLGFCGRRRLEISGFGSVGVFGWLMLVILELKILATGLYWLPGGTRLDFSTERDH